ncbi:MAG: AAA family ATPase, partial [Candidatus Aenigmarchaeota archaeon]|nr:AAA family ATPase [Candidatus Aenigmarchaeota archaeon]
EALGYRARYAYDIINKNVGIPVSKFMKLVELSGVGVDPSAIKIYSKRKSIPALFPVTKEFSEILGLFIAEGSYNHKDTTKEVFRMSLHEREADYFRELCENVFGKVCIYRKAGTRGADIYVSSRVASIFLRKMLGIGDGALEKRIPEVVFGFSRDNIFAFLKGCFSGDGTVYFNQHGVPTVEFSTRSDSLADGIMYLLLSSGIVAKLYRVKQKDGVTNRVCFTGAHNIKKFEGIGFADASKNAMMAGYLSATKFERNNQAVAIARSSSGISELREDSAAVEIELDVNALLKADIYWDVVEDITELDRHDKYVYDISVSPRQNFVGGFGGVFAHNSEENLRKIFEDAEKEAPSIIFIDEIDSIAPKREEVTGEVERRVVSTLLTQMDGLKSRGKVIVIAATNRENSIDPALRRPGRFDREVEIGVPDQKGRKEILQIHTRNMPLTKDVDLNWLSSITYGFVGADLEALAKEAAMSALRRNLPGISWKKNEEIPADVIEKLKVEKQDFENALKMVEPSAMREVLIEIPNVTWNDVGGLEDVKGLLKEVVEWPLKNPDAFRRVGIRPPTGVLLYGPPGTGKTMLAKAVAHEAGANFISIKGPEILSKWVGESEKHIRDIFRRAKQVAPAIIFFDEIDSVAPRRGRVNDSTHVTENVVSSILTEMSGLEELHNVVVLAATNRPDIIDSALLRPGRFDRQIIVPAPDEKTRLEIFKIHAGKMPFVDREKFFEGRGKLSDKEREKMESEYRKENEKSMLKVVTPLAKETDGYSGADIEALVREAGLNALRKDMKAKEVTAKNFADAMKKVKPSINPKVLEFYRRAEERLKTTVKESKPKEDELVYVG